MATYVLVHGGGHGGWCYRSVIKLLRARGHDVYAPSLTGLGEREHLFCCDVDLDCHIKCFDQPLRLTDEDAVAKIPQSYICTTMFIKVRPVETLKQKADGRFWELNTGHDTMITAPEWVAEKLMLVASLADESLT